MACFYPMKAFRASDGSGRLVFSRKSAFVDLPVTIACGQCSGCRLERSRQWAVRCLHESKLWNFNCFITLTYSDNFLPSSRSLVLKDFQDFMKRLRYRCGSGIRFFHCGEYGPKLGRPHYHALIFNFDFDDRVIWRRNHDGDNVYTSKKLEALWEFKGFCTVGDVSFKSAAYCARYVMKKMTGPLAKDHYEYVDPDTGELFDRSPEYVTMSRRPGIGRGHLDKYLDDIFPSDFVVVNGTKARPPRFYDGVYEVLYPSDFVRLKARRIRNAELHSDNNSPDRLKVRSELQDLKLKRLIRGVS